MIQDTQALKIKILSIVDLLPLEGLQILARFAELLRKAMAKSVNADRTSFEQQMHEFNVALRQAGYETDDDVRRLIHEVKAEQATEWFRS